MSPTVRLFGVCALAAAAAAGCRGGASEDPPVHVPAPDMDWQAHRRPQSHSPVFSDKRAMRPIDPHTVPHGFTEAETRNALKDDEPFFKGTVGRKPVRRMPMEVNQAVLDRGQERFNIFCAPCHDKTGAGNGIVAQRSGGAFTGMPSFTLDRLVDAPDGEIFQTITDGRARMPAYGHQIPEADRWAIVAWVRVLQASQGSKVDVLTDEEKRKLAPASGGNKEAK